MHSGNHLNKRYSGAHCSNNSREKKARKERGNVTVHSAPVTEASVSAKSLPENKKSRRKGRKLKLLDLVFYCLVIVLFVLILINGSSGKPMLFAGYGVFTVATGSMEDVLPQGSLIITKHVDPATLQIGDDITYLTGPSSTITHRIISISEKEHADDQRIFYTKGVMNKDPDLLPVPEVNVVGKVVYNNLTLGKAVQFIHRNWPVALFVLLVLVIWLKIMIKLFRPPKNQSS